MITFLFWSKIVDNDRVNEKTRNKKKTSLI